MSYMKIAVLMSTYNGEKYLEEQLDSILKQDIDVDIIIRDDGSTDGTIKILKKYESTGKLNWYQGNNLGPAKSFIDVLKKADAYDFYAFADQDDYWYESKIRRGVNMIKDLHGMCMYYSNASTVDENRVKLGRNVYNKSPKTDICTLTCAGGILGCTMIINQELANKIRNYKFPEKIVMHDFYISLICAIYNGTIVYDNRNGLDYRQHGNNVVGVDSGILDKIKGRIRTIITKPNVSIAEQAMSIIDVYENEIDGDIKEWLEKVATYRNSISRRIALAMTGKTSYVNFNKAFTLRMAILLGNR